MSAHGRRHAERRLRAGRPALRAADRHDAAGRARLREAGYAEILRRIREEEPPKPSTRLGLGRAAAVDRGPRQTEPARLTKLVRGELDWIVMKALEKDRTRRYETANGFARDIERYLDGDPVRPARRRRPTGCGSSPASTGRRWSRPGRSRRCSAAAAVSTWQAVRATRPSGWPSRAGRLAGGRRDGRGRPRRPRRSSRATPGTRRRGEGRQRVPTRTSWPRPSPRSNSAEDVDARWRCSTAPPTRSAAVRATSREVEAELRARSDDLP